MQDLCKYPFPVGPERRFAITRFYAHPAVVIRREAEGFPGIKESTQDRIKIKQKNGGRMLYENKGPKIPGPHLF
jgi:hypothetical protein